MGAKILLDEDLVIEKYNELNSTRKVSKFFGVSYGPIKSILKSRGINYSQRKNFVNEMYFDSIDSEEKAYWLGFLYADGYIRERKSGSSLELKLSQLDINHLELFKKTLNSTHKIVLNVSKTYNKHGKECFSNMAHFAIYSNRLVNSIKSQGFHSRKTFTIDKPNIDNQYIRHFLRGFFDGDGCFYIKKDKNCNFLTTRYGFTCASTKFKNFIIEELNKNSISVKSYGDFQLNVTSYSDCLKLYHYFYNDATIYLKRKKEKGDTFIEYYTMKRDKGIFCFQNEYIPIKRVWTKDEINILNKYRNLIPLSYLSYSILPTKNKKQIFRYCRKNGIKNDKRMSQKDYEEFCYNNNITPYTHKL